MSSRDPLQPWRPRSGARHSAWARATALHAFRRVGFGASRERVDRALDEGPEATLSELLARDEHDAGLLNGIDALLPVNEVENLQAWWTALVLADGAPFRRQREK